MENNENENEKNASLPDLLFKRLRLNSVSSAPPTLVEERARCNGGRRSCVGEEKKDVEGEKSCPLK